MSLLHSILSARTLRHAAQARDIHRRDRRAVVTADDVVVTGRSLAQLASSRGTPSVLVTSAVDIRQRDTHFTWVLTRVTAVSGEPHGHRREITIDASLQEIASVITQTHIVGARPPKKTRTVTVTGADQVSIDVRIPAGTEPGAVIAFRCASTVALSQVRPHTSTARTGDVDDTTWGARCMK